jgi:hypothetical protein
MLASLSMSADVVRYPRPFLHQDRALCCPSVLHGLPFSSLLLASACSSEFNETTKIFFWSWATTGKFFYDAGQNAQLVHRENGRGDRCVCLF